MDPVLEGERPIALERRRLVPEVAGFLDHPRRLGVGLPHAVHGRQEAGGLGSGDLQRVGVQHFHAQLFRRQRAVEDFLTVLHPAGHDATVVAAELAADRAADAEGEVLSGHVAGIAVGVKNLLHRVRLRVVLHPGHFWNDAEGVDQPILRHLPGGHARLGLQRHFVETGQAGVGLDQNLNGAGVGRQ